MTDFIIKQYIIIKLNLKNKFDYTDTKTVYLANYPMNTTDGIDSFFVIDLLNGISSLGEEVGESVSKTTSATINFNCELDSSGFQRRLVDIFDRYTAINQDVSIFYYESMNAIDNVYAAETAFTEAYKGYVKEYSFDLKQCRLSIDQLRWPGEYLNYIVPNNSDFFSQNAIGGSLSLPLGEYSYHAPSILLDNIDSNEASTLGLTAYGSYFALATDRVNYSGGSWASEGNLSYPDGFTASTYFIHISESNRYIINYTAPSDYKIANNDSGGTTSDLSLVDTDVIYIKLELDSSVLPYTLSGIGLRLKYNSTASTTGNFNLALYYKGSGDALPQKINSTDISKYGTSITASYADVAFLLQKPVVLSISNLVNGDYYIGLENLTGQTVDVLIRQNSYSTESYYLKAAGSSNGFISYNSAARFSGVVYGVRYVLETLTYADTVVDGKSPLLLGALSYSDQTDPVTGYTYPVTDVSNLKIVSSCCGYNDGAGTPTYYNTPVTSIKYLMREFNESTTTWGTSTIFDDSYFSDSHAALTAFPRYTIGAITKKVTLLDCAREIMQQSESKFLFKNDKWGVYTTGSSLSNSFHIFDKDIVSFKHLTDKKSSVVNYVQSLYRINLLQTNTTGIFLEDRWWSYSQSLISGYNDNSFGEAISANSYNIFGKNEKAVTDYPLVYDDDSMENLHKIILSIYNLPREFIEVEVPYMDFADIDIMDVGHISSAYLPSNFGSTTSPNDYIYTDTSGDNADCDIIGETGITRNQAVKVQVFKKQIQLNNKNQPALLRLKLKVDNSVGGIY